MIRRLFLSAALVVPLVVGVAGVAQAANPSPTGTGQPSTSCDTFTTAPGGFSSGGFVNVASNVYANPGTTPAASSAPVSQYDVACYQLTTNGGH